MRLSTVRRKRESVADPSPRTSELRKALVPYFSVLLRSTELKSFKQLRMRQKSFTLITSCSELETELLRRLRKKPRLSRGVRTELRGLQQGRLRRLSKRLKNSNRRRPRRLRSSLKQSPKRRPVDLGRNRRPRGSARSMGLLR